MHAKAARAHKKCPTTDTLAAMKPGLLALDYDGVVWDCLEEMAESAWRTLPSPPPLSDELRARFAALRPAIESGWEMVALMGMLTERPAGDDAQLRDAAQFVTARDAWMQTHGRVAAELGAALDAARAKWMADDVRGWLGRPRFYPGIAAWLGKLIAEEQLVYVISRKARQFIEALLVWETVPLQPEYVIGRAEPKREKWDVLQTLAIQHDVQATDVWFVEDRLATLEIGRAHV